MSFGSRLCAWIKQNSQYSEGGPELAIEEAVERRAAVVADSSLPTFENVYGCTDCGVIQIRPENYHCALCGSDEVVNLALQLRRGAMRIDNRAARIRRTKHS